MRSIYSQQPPIFAKKMGERQSLKAMCAVLSCLPSFPFTTGSRATFSASESAVRMYLRQRREAAPD
jgi:hypothetical protein